MENNIFNIVCISNNIYTQHAAVMLTSLFKTNPKVNCNIYLFTTEIDKNNEKLEKDAKKEILDKINWKLKEMFDFASRNEAENFDDAYITKWA